MEIDRNIDTQVFQDQGADDIAVFSQQHRWIREGGTGCVFSQALATRNEKGAMQWTNLIERATPEELMSTEKGEAYMEALRKSVAEGKDELFSTIFPNVNTGESLAKLMAYLGSQPPFRIDEIATGKVHENNPNLYNGLYLRLDFSDEAESWPLVLGPYEFFSPGRRAPYTQLIFRPTPVKGNPTTPEGQVGIDDTILPVNPSTFQHLYKRTVQSVAETRGDYNQELFRARVAVVVPQQDWEQAQAELGIQY